MMSVVLIVYKYNRDANSTHSMATFPNPRGVSACGIINTANSAKLILAGVLQIEFNLRCWYWADICTNYHRRYKICKCRFYWWNGNKFGRHVWHTNQHLETRELSIRLLLRNQLPSLLNFSSGTPLFTALEFASSVSYTANNLLLIGGANGNTRYHSIYQ